MKSWKSLRLVFVLIGVFFSLPAFSVQTVDYDPSKALGKQQLVKDSKSGGLADLVGIPYRYEVVSFRPFRMPKGIFRLLAVMKTVIVEKGDELYEEGKVIITDKIFFRVISEDAFENDPTVISHIDPEKEMSEEQAKALLDDLYRLP